MVASVNATNVPSSSKSALPAGGSLLNKMEGLSNKEITPSDTSGKNTKVDLRSFLEELPSNVAKNFEGIERKWLENIQDPVLALQCAKLDAREKLPEYQSAILKTDFEKYLKELGCDTPVSAFALNKENLNIFQNTLLALPKDLAKKYLALVEKTQRNFDGYTKDLGKILQEKMPGIAEKFLINGNSNRIGDAMLAVSELAKSMVGEGNDPKVLCLVNSTLAADLFNRADVSGQVTIAKYLALFLDHGNGVVKADKMASQIQQVRNVPDPAAEGPGTVNPSMGNSTPFPGITMTASPVIKFKPKIEINNDGNKAAEKSQMQIGEMISDYLNRMQKNPQNPESQQGPELKAVDVAVLKDQGYVSEEESILPKKDEVDGSRVLIQEKESKNAELDTYKTDKENKAEKAEKAEKAALANRQLSFSEQIEDARRKLRKTGFQKNIPAESQSTIPDTDPINSQQNKEPVINDMGSQKQSSSQNFEEIVKGFSTQLLMQMLRAAGLSGTVKVGGNHLVIGFDRLSTTQNPVLVERRMYASQDRNSVNNLTGKYRDTYVSRDRQLITELLKQEFNKGDEGDRRVIGFGEKLVALNQASIDMILQKEKADKKNRFSYRTANS